MLIGTNKLDVQTYSIIICNLLVFVQLNVNQISLWTFWPVKSSFLGGITAAKLLHTGSFDQNYCHFTIHFTPRMAWASKEAEMSSTPKNVFEGEILCSQKAYFWQILKKSDLLKSGWTTVHQPNRFKFCIFWDPSHA